MPLAAVSHWLTVGTRTASRRATWGWLKPATMRQDLNNSPCTGYPATTSA
jgi:hypothetical protein